MPEHGSAFSKAGAGLAVGAVGVVFGDIGTSPLYVIQECFRGTTVTEPAILGVGSLIFWTLSILVSFKYVSMLLGATVRGEGGIFALFSLCRKSHFVKPVLFAGGAIAGASLLYGDGVITPAISVISAVEGLEHFSPGFGKYVVTGTCLILAALFLVQPLGTGRIGRSFGIVMVTWFLTIGIIGMIQITKTPAILKCINPAYAFHFLFAAETKTLVILGGVLLCITGAEALFADVGHFGKNAVRLGWWGLVKPCLLASYFGQLGWLLHQTGSELTANPVFGIVPAAIGNPFVVLATAAAVIASQALISGVFSLTEQGIRLSFLPRLRVIHTSATERGQVFLPGINLLLMLSCIGLVIVFKSSSNLASAYGLSVITGMTITSCFYFVHARRNRQQWPLAAAAGMVGLWLLVELTFLGAASTKFFAGAWIPAVFTVLLFLIMQTWRRGSQALRQADSPEERIPIGEILSAAPRMTGTSGVILSSDSLKPELSDYINRFGALPENLVILTVEHTLDARVPKGEQVQIKEAAPGIHTLAIRIGFAETPDIRAGLVQARAGGSRIDPDTVTYFAFRRTLITHPGASRELAGPLWSRALFAFLHRQSSSPWRAFKLPSDRVVEIGISESF